VCSDERAAARGIRLLLRPARMVQAVFAAGAWEETPFARITRHGCAAPEEAMSQRLGSEASEAEAARAAGVALDDAERALK
jgi:hypothetical protein